MFEQSLLVNDSMARKSGAFAASLSAQILFTGVLILIPLAYQEVMPLVKLSIPLAGPILTPPPPVMPPSQTQSSSFTRTRGPRPIFVAPTVVPRGPVPQIIDSFDSAPPVSAIENGLSHFPLGVAGITRTDLAKPPDTPTATPSPKPDAAPVPLGGVVLAAQLIKKVVPVYPVVAIKARVSGTVRLEGILAKDGTIRSLRVLSGHPLLVSAALEAVRQWVYHPTLLNGAPVEVIAPIDVVFTLN
jgi:protein TonB